MKLLTLSVLLLTASASCSAMLTLEITPVDMIKAYGKDARKRNVEFNTTSIILNGVSTLYKEIDE